MAAQHGAAEDGLDLVTVHPIADPDPDAAIPEGLAAAVDLPDIEGAMASSSVI